MLPTKAMVVTSALLAAAAAAHAQPGPLTPVPLPDPPAPADGATPPAPDAPPDAPPADHAAPTVAPPAVEPPPVSAPPPVAPAPPRPFDRRRFELPEIITAPTARLLQAGVLYSRSGLDTGGGLSSDLRVGLGEVAEFGVATTDQLRARTVADPTPRRISPYVTATFRMGIAEDRLFRGQPALVLGFRKSFERTQDDHTSRIAELHLVGSKRLGPRATIHLGGVFWDASLRHGDEDAFALHDRGIANQLRGFGGVELRPLDDALILIDLSWVPQLCYECGVERVSLRPVFSWGVRYEIADWIQVQSGVTVPDIQDANLLDAQIFGQVTLFNRALHHAVAAR
jgi:hypothetical protein